MYRDTHKERGLCPRPTHGLQLTCRQACFICRPFIRHYVAVLYTELLSSISRLSCFGRLNFLFWHIEKWLSPVLINLSARLYETGNSRFLQQTMSRRAQPITTNAYYLSHISSIIRTVFRRS